MNGEIDLLCQECIFDLFDEEALPPDLGQRHIEDFIARGLDALDRDGETGDQFLKTRLNPLALMHG